MQIKRRYAIVFISAKINSTNQSSTLSTLSSLIYVSESEIEANIGLSGCTEEIMPEIHTKNPIFFENSNVIKIPPKIETVLRQWRGKRF